jgi:hypothetical protein
MIFNLIGSRVASIDSALSACMSRGPWDLYLDKIVFSIRIAPLVSRFRLLDIHFAFKIKIPNEPFIKGWL